MNPAIPMSKGTRPAGMFGPAKVTALLTAGALMASALSLSHILPFFSGIQAIYRPDFDDLQQIVVHYAWLPRLVVSILCGAGLGLAGAVFQQLLRNPLADPTTLGVSAGAQLALTLTTLFAPSLLMFGTEAVAISGAAIAAALITFLAWRSTLSPTVLIVGGLMVSLYADTFGTVLALLFGNDLRGVFIWSTGTLSQNDWSAVTYLLPRMGLAAAMIIFVARPLSIIALDDESARSLGLPLRTIRLLAIAPAIAISAFVVSSVGVLGFIGLAAPTLARLTGARNFTKQLIWAPIIGAALLWLTDQLVQLAADARLRVPTGTATAMLGAPLLLWLLPQMKAELPAKPNALPRATRPWVIVGISFLLLAVTLWPAVDFARSYSGWHFDSWNDLQRLLSLRGPRVVAALSAGGMLAIAGALMQRFTGNVLASPEILGISSGASLAALLFLLLMPSPGSGALLAAASFGALTILFIMLMLGHRTAFSPQHMLLTGIALSTSVNAITALLLASGTPQLSSAISWLSGSTYRVDTVQSFSATLILLAVLLTIPLLTRWLEILPLGEASSRAVGVNIKTSRLVVLIMAAILTGAATLIVGPLSFVGLMAPHMARMLGLQRPMVQLVGAAILGSLIMVFADWLGRNLLFPSQIPAGLLATFIGGPYFFVLMRKSMA